MYFNLKAEKSLLTAIVNEPSLLGAAMAALELQHLSPDTQQVLRAIQSLETISAANLVMLTDKYTPINIDGLDIGLTFTLLNQAAEMKRIKEAAYAIGKSSDIKEVRTLAYNIPSYSRPTIQEMDDVVNDFLADNNKIIPSHYERITGGITVGTLTTIAGRPGMGKTTLALDMAYHYAQAGYNTIFITMEMAAVHVLSKVVGYHLNYTDDDMRNWRDKPIAPNIRRAVSEIRALPFKIIAPTANTVEAVIGVCEQLRPDVFFIDYIQLMNTGSSRSDRVLELGTIGRAVQNYCRNRSCNGFVVSQLSRATESREDKRPTLSDLRGSGELEEATALVLFPYRPNYYDPDDQGNAGEIIVAKNRYGRIGTQLVEIQRGHYERHNH